MPMIDVTIPEGALKPEAEGLLLKELTDILIMAEGFRSDNKVAQNVTWLFLHRPAAIYVAGARSKTPRYRIVPTVPEGQYTDAARERRLPAFFKCHRHQLLSRYADLRPLLPARSRSWLPPTSRSIRSICTGSRARPHGRPGCRC